jgi:hypothetical protein
MVVKLNYGLFRSRNLCALAISKPVSRSNKNNFFNTNTFKYLNFMRGQTSDKSGNSFLSVMRKIAAGCKYIFWASTFIFMDW